ncbi:MAG: hypothetical protein J7K47_05320 [Thermoplasmata archaeon]|nr:hypothetical protein [Thermoplasmata archaeon]
MANLNAVVIGRKGYGREIGKKGTESDVTFYNFKKGSAHRNSYRANKLS